MPELSSSQIGFDVVVRSVASALKPLGFSRSGTTFRRIQGEMCGLVQLQRSTSNTRDFVKFTVNVGVVCGALLGSRSSLKKCQVFDSHAGCRLAFLNSGRRDGWWSIDASTSVGPLAAEVADAIVQFAVPFLDRFGGPDDLRKGLESGLAPGGTDGHRRDLIERLERYLAPKDPRAAPAGSADSGPPGPTSSPIAGEEKR